MLVIVDPNEVPPSEFSSGITCIPGGKPQTLLRIEAHPDRPVIIKDWNLSFDGTSSANHPATVRIIRQGDLATNSSRPVRLHALRGVHAIFATDFAAEPETIEAIRVHDQIPAFGGTLFANLTASNRIRIEPGTAVGFVVECPQTVNGWLVVKFEEENLKPKAGTGEPSSMRRFKILKASSEFLLSPMKTGHENGFDVIKNALPPDAEITAVTMDPFTTSVAFRVRSEAFPEVSDGQTIPTMDPPVFCTRVPDVAKQVRNARPLSLDAKSRIVEALRTYDPGMETELRAGGELVSGYHVPAPTLSATLTRDDLRAALYDLERTPEGRVRVVVMADGAARFEPVVAGKPT